MIRAVRALDRALLVRARSLETPAVTAVMCAATRLGDASCWVAVAGALVAAGGAVRPLGARVAVATVLATGIVQLLKRTCRRSRPEASITGFTALAASPDRFSFPSGHAAAAAAAAVALAGAGALATAAAAFAPTVAVSRVYLGAHYPLDVGAGVVVGAAAGLVARLALTG